MLLRLSPRIVRAAGCRSAHRLLSVQASKARKPTDYGQPVFSSHPHLARAHEVTPGMPREEYQRRRRELMDKLPEGSIAVLVSAPTKYMSGNIFYKYRQHSDFWYLTGFEEPNSAVIFEKTSSAAGYRMTMFSQGKDSHREKWEGASTGFELVQEHCASDDAQPSSSFFATLKATLDRAEHVYVDLPEGASSSRRKSTFDLFGPAEKSKRMLDYLSGRKANKTEYDKLIEGLTAPKRRPLAPEVGMLRAVKSVHEQEVMRAAAEISAKAHTKTMRFAQPGMSEASLAAHFEYLCALGGAQRPAYVPVVASGANALIIHYVSNNQLIGPDEMVLFDGGCEYKFPRTYPASGTFTPAQRDLYAAVLAAQKALVALCTEESRISLHELHRKSVDLLRQELNQIGFRMMANDLERELYPHYISHSIGIDLHESAHFDRMAPLREGMVLTVEPGVYVPPSALFPSHFHGLGVRIEDQVLIGKAHPDVLSISAPKEIADVEGACQGLLGLEPY